MFEYTDDIDTVTNYVDYTAIFDTVTKVFHNITLDNGSISLRIQSQR